MPISQSTAFKILTRSRTFLQDICEHFGYSTHSFVSEDVRYLTSVLLKVTKQALHESCLACK
jgi:hypothetical protein